MDITHHHMFTNTLQQQQAHQNAMAMNHDHNFDPTLWPNFSLPNPLFHMPSSTQFLLLEQQLADHQTPTNATIAATTTVTSLNSELGLDQEDEPEEELGAMKEMMFKIACMQPVDIDPATICKPKRRNVRISDDPQSVAARHRRERISEKIRILQRLVPGGTKLDTASMLDEAIRYVKFLKRQIRVLQTNKISPPPPLPHIGVVPTTGTQTPDEEWTVAKGINLLSTSATETSYGLGHHGSNDPRMFFKVTGHDD